ncbi:MAG: type IV secretory system conjugative DNA transfer family protein [Pseudochelatococcus sp.]|jgi:type IV secretion system protein VirD4|uniref:type IV secretory system conjugative DNA transfer family protein n=1 Tax=Pseudochelatococcus sp. TaxID=2020869 RepID=UPI003D89DB4B
MKFDDKTFRLAGTVAAIIGVMILVGDLSMTIKGSLSPPRNAFGYKLPDTTHWRMLAIAASGVGGFGVGWFLSPSARRFRLALFVILAAALVLAVYIDNGALGWGLTPVASIIAFAAGLGYWMRGVVSRLSETPTTFGSAKWADNEHLAENDIVGTDGLRLGHRYDERGAKLPLRYKGDRHILTCAPNRSGKGTTAIIPNLLTYPGSMVVIDPKGENAMMTAQRRKDMGQEVHVVDPWGITSAAGLPVSRFNPLDLLVPGDIDLAENAMLLADAMIVPSDKGNPFWDESGRGFTVGPTGHVATHEDEAGNRNLGRVRDLLLLDGNDMQALHEKMLQSPYHFIRSAGARALQQEEKLRANIIATVQSQTNFLDSPRIRESLSASDFRFEDLKTKPMTVYLVLPSDRLNAFSRWLRLLIQQAITVNARNIEVQPEHPVLFILDELPALGRLSMIEQAFGLMAGYGIQLWGVAQDLSQLKRIYGDGWETFISNAGVVQYFGSRDRMTADYFSALCGQTTIWNVSSAISRAIGSTSGNSASHSETTTNSDTTAAAMRKLAYPDELMRLPRGKQLLFINNLNPIQSYRTPWFEDENLRDLGRNLRA